MTPTDLLSALFDPRRAAWTDAFRIEVRGAYASDRADPRWEPVLRGEMPPPEPNREWYVVIRALRAAGRTVRRVRVVESPLTPGQHYLRVIGVSVL